MEASAKRNCIEKILANSTYSHNSGMIENLRKSLSRLSGNDLSCLKQLIEIRERDAEQSRDPAK